MMHTASEGRKPMPNTSAQMASTIAAIAQTAIDGGIRLEGALANHDFLGFVAVVNPLFLELHIVDGRFLFGTHLLGGIHALLLNQDGFHQNGEGTPQCQ